MTLVEEIFLQIMRQINNNPRIESQRRGFELPPAGQEPTSS